MSYYYFMMIEIAKNVYESLIENLNFFVNMFFGKGFIPVKFTNGLSDKINI